MRKIILATENFFRTQKKARVLVPVLGGAREREGGRERGGERERGGGQQEPPAGGGGITHSPVWFWPGGAGMPAEKSGQNFSRGFSSLWQLEKEISFLEKNKRIPVPPPRDGCAPLRTQKKTTDSLFRELYMSKGVQIGCDFFGCRCGADAGFLVFYRQCIFFSRFIDLSIYGV